MHIPDHMIQGPICPVTAVAAAVGIGTAAYFAVKAKNKPSALKFGAAAAFIFAAQMMNFPVQNGTSGHLLGAVLACALLGTPFGIIAMSLVLAIQTLVFSDGGLTVMGANIVNMALIGGSMGAIFNKVAGDKIQKMNLKGYSILGILAWASVVFAALACSLELAVSGTIAFSKAAPAMIGVHALIGIGEAVLTLAVYYLFSFEAVKASEKLSYGVPVVTAGIIGLLLSPFASGFPDGLEWVAERYQFLHESAPAFVSPLPDYAVPAVANQAVSTGLAGLTGVILTFIIGALIGKMLSFKAQEQ